MTAHSVNTFFVLRSRYAFRCVLTLRSNLMTSSCCISKYCTGRDVAVGLSEIVSAACTETARVPEVVRALALLEEVSTVYRKRRQQSTGMAFVAPHSSSSACQYPLKHILKCIKAGGIKLYLPTYMSQRCKGGGLFQQRLFLPCPSLLFIFKPKAEGVLCYGSVCGILSVCNSLLGSRHRLCRGLLNGSQLLARLACRGIFLCSQRAQPFLQLCNLVTSCDVRQSMQHTSAYIGCQDSRVRPSSELKKRSRVSW